MFVTRKRFESELGTLEGQLDVLRRQVANLEVTVKTQRATVTRYSDCLSTLLHHLNLRFEYEEARPAQYVLKEAK
jgi:hypothetical protein